jgi:glycosyltransferase involved in cell wall biosynthesis
MADRVPTTLVSFGEEAREETMGALRIKVLRRTWAVRGQPHNPLSLALIPEILRADVVHCHQQHIVASSVSAIVARAAGKRVFVSDLGGGGWDFSAYVSTDRWYQGHLHISQYSRRIYGQQGKPWARVIYGGVDAVKFSPAPRDIGRYGAILYVGRLLPHKGVNDLVEAATPEMRVELIGRPYDDSFLLELQRLAAGKSVAFRHECSDEEVVAAYQQALCLVLPSVYRTADGRESKVPELLGQTLLEAMACGVPAICTDVASMPEVVDDGVTGFVVPPNDPAAIRAKLVWLADHPEEAAKMGEAGRRRAIERFSWDDVVRRCLDAYAEPSRQRAEAAQ